MSDHTALLTGIVLVVSVVLGTGVVIYGISIFQPKLEEQKCYGASCTNPHLGNEIIGMDFQREYVYLLLKDGTDVKTDCLTNDYPYGQNATYYWCSDGVKKGVFGN